MTGKTMGVRSGSSVIDERAFWHPIQGEWRRLYGSFREFGVSVEWHDISPDEPVRWEKSFHDDSLEICLNLSGTGELAANTERLQIGPATAAFYRPLPGMLRATRRANERHRFATVELGRDFLEQELAGTRKAVHPFVSDFLHDRHAGSLGAVLPMRLELTQIAEAMPAPRVPPAAAPLWYRGKILGVLSELLFVSDNPEEFFCTRQKRLAVERVQRAREIITANLECPPCLDDLARQIACSPFYLSRLFSQQMGISMAKYIRRARIERAADLLRTGKCNVTEAAFAVGYSSLSHFSKAFYEVMGCCPGLYPKWHAGIPQHLDGAIRNAKTP